MGLSLGIRAARWKKSRGLSGSSPGYALPATREPVDPAPPRPAADGAPLRITLVKLRRAVDDLARLGQDLHDAAQEGAPPSAKTVDAWLHRIRDDVGALSHAITTLWRGAAPVAPTAVRPSERLLDHLIERRIATVTAHLVAASSAEADVAVQRALRRRAKRLAPDARRRLQTIWAASQALCTLLLPGIIREVPSVTRQDLRWALAQALPGSRGGRGGPWTRRFDDGALLAIEAALRAEHPGWGRRAAVEAIANRLVVDPKTVSSALRRAERARKNS